MKISPDLMYRFVASRKPHGRDDGFIELTLRLQLAGGKPIGGAR
jgi:hypothetical protein